MGNIILASRYGDNVQELAAVIGTAIALSFPQFRVGEVVKFRRKGEVEPNPLVTYYVVKEIEEVPSFALPAAGHRQWVHVAPFCGGEVVGPYSGFHLEKAY